MHKTHELFATLVIAVLCLLTSCDKDDLTTNRYSTKYPVRFYYETAVSTELMNAVGNPGQFVTIRPITGKIIIANTQGETTYPLSQIGYKEFEYGLGGLIVGTSSTPNKNGGFDLVAYDLGCPNCDRKSIRLTLRDNGTVNCKSCGITYDLNNFGWIIEKPDDCKFDKPRGLYNYRIYYNATPTGMAINVNNF